MLTCTEGTTLLPVIPFLTELVIPPLGVLILLLLFLIALLTDEGFLVCNAVVLLFLSSISMRLLKFLELLDNELLARMLLL